MGDISLLNDLPMDEAVLIYFKMGLNVLPCVPNEKGCHEYGWNHPDFNFDPYYNAREKIWGGEKHNIGVRLDNIVTFDVDDLEKTNEIFDSGLRDDLVKRFGECFYDSQTAHIMSGAPNKDKLVFKIPNNLDLSYHKLTLAGKTCFELRCGNNHFDIFPNSYHPSGSRYRWEGKEILEIPASLIDFWVHYDRYEPWLQKHSPTYKEDMATEFSRQLRNYTHSNPMVQKWVDMQYLPNWLSQCGFVHHRGTRWSLPNHSNQGIDIVQDGQRFWSYSESSPFLGHPANSFDLLVEYECDGDVNKAMEYIRNDLAKRGE